MARFIDLIGQIDKLGLENFADIRTDNRRITEVFFVGGPENLPDGEVRFESFDEKECRGKSFYYCPWKAVVEKNGIKFTALVNEEQAWSLYV